MVPNPIHHDPMLADALTETSKMLTAWAFAAGEASEALEEIVKARSERAHEAVDEGKRWVRRMRELLGDNREFGQEVSVNRDEGGDRDAGEEDEDVWAIEAGVGSLARSKPSVKGMEDHWAGLQGDVGLRKGT